MIEISPVDIIRGEKNFIQRIIDDEKWLESERRGFDVGPQDRQLLFNVASVILRVGQDIRQKTIRNIEREIAYRNRRM